MTHAPSRSSESSGSQFHTMACVLCIPEGVACLLFGALLLLGCAQAPQSSIQADGKVTSSARPARSLDEIRQAFDATKTKIFRVYDTALQQQPTLQGKVVLELRIAPSGQVLDARMLSTTMGAPSFEAQLLDAVRTIDFHPRPVEAMRLTWPMEFLPH